jgi:excisionase family DNA binding protein
MADDILTVDQAAAVLQLHPYTVRKMLREGTLPGRKLGAKEWRVSRQALDDFMRGEGPTAVKSPEVQRKRAKK